MPTSRSRRLHDLMILSQSERLLSDASWDAWIDYSISHSYRAVLVSAHSGLTPQHRRRLAERRKQAGLGPETVALLTESALLRGVMTAVAWVTGNSVKAFAPQDVTPALAWLGVTVPLADVKATIDELHAAMSRASQVA